MVHTKSRNTATSSGSPAPRAEFFTLAGIAAASTGAISAGEKIYKAVSSPDPLDLRVLSSAAVDNFHRVAFQALNQTMHGVYLEGISLAQPKSKITRIFAENKVTYGDNDKNIIAFPTLIPPGESLTFTIEFPLINSANKAFGLIALRYSPLSEKAELQRKDVFRIRWA